MVDPELWLLETVVEIPMPFWSLVHPRIEELLNKAGHGLGLTALSELLERLNWNGDIFIEDEHCRKRLYSANELSGLLRRGRRTGDHRWGLTEKGGARWEREADADWSRYVSEAWGTLEETGSEETHLWEGEVACTDPERLDRWIVVRLPAFGQQILPGTEKREVVAPWKATYWKTLPVGHRLTGKVLYGCPEIRGASGYSSEFDVWYRSSCKDA